MFLKQILKVRLLFFNGYFSNQCNTFDNGSLLPDLNYRTPNRLSYINFSSTDISKIIRDLNPNKSHGHDNLSIRMIQVYNHTPNYSILIGN